MPMVVKARAWCPKGHVMEEWKGHRAFGVLSRGLCTKCQEIYRVTWVKLDPQPSVSAVIERTE